MGEEEKVQNQSKRSYRIDLIKAICIIAVVLYHFGFLPKGYLGVDVFFVIAGYFMMNSYLKQKEKNSYSYVKSTVNHIMRFWPLILVVVAICLAIGFFTMLPDDFENLSESAVASNVFANNILSAITTRNYWNTSNDFKPLMHLWYIGVLAQAYILLPLFFMLFDKINRKALIIATICITLLSLSICFLPFFSDGAKFYYLPFRIYELTLGSCICFFKKTVIKNSVSTILQIVCICLLTAIFVTNLPLGVLPIQIIVVSLTVLLVYLCETSEEYRCVPLLFLSKIGKASFSIYLIHQPVIAFTRYLFTSNFSFLVFAINSLTIIFLSVIFYLLGELKISSLLKTNLAKPIAVTISSFLVLTAVSGFYYLKAGVVRDVPEMDIELGKAHRGMHAEYVDAPYSWDMDFQDEEKIRVLVIGDSLARDWCNVLNESENSSKYEISYSYTNNTEVKQSAIERAEMADYIFYATIGDSTLFTNQIMNKNNFYVVGIKKFGDSNGQVYQKRFRKDYYNTYVAPGYSSELRKNVLKQNKEQREFWGDKYIDLITPVQNSDSKVRVFTDTNKFISSDTIHFTKNGAVFYSKVLDLSFIR